MWRSFSAAPAHGKRGDAPRATLLGQPCAVAASLPGQPAARGAAPSARPSDGQRRGEATPAWQNHSAVVARTFLRLYSFARAASACSCSALAGTSSICAGISARWSTFGCCRARHARVSHSSVARSPCHEEFPQPGTHVPLAASFLSSALCGLYGCRVRGTAGERPAAAISNLAHNPQHRVGGCLTAPQHLRYECAAVQRYAVPHARAWSGAQGDFNDVAARRQTAERSVGTQSQQRRIREF